MPGILLSGKNGNRISDFIFRHSKTFRDIKCLSEYVEH